MAEVPEKGRYRVTLTWEAEVEARTPVIAIRAAKRLVRERSRRASVSRAVAVKVPR